jgi:iron complex outermembrane receptor protein
VQALQRGGIAPPEASNSGASFGPIKSTQYEAGIKVDRGSWGATIAAFKTNVPSEFTTAATSTQPGTFLRDGEREFKGIEFDSHWQPTKELFLKFGVSYLDAVQTKAAAANQVGKKVPGTTAFQTSGFVEYTPSYIPGLSVFGGVRHSGKSYGQILNTFVFDPVTIGDLGISYELPASYNHVKISANVQNVTDEWYWVPAASGTSLSAGAPRTFSLSLSVSTGPIDRSGEQAGGIGDLSGGIRDKGFYLGLAAGAQKTAAGSFDIRARNLPATGLVKDGLQTRYKTGWEVAGTLGYDFGLFRTELEASHQQFELKQATLNSTSIPLDAAVRTVGTYNEPSGTTRLLAFLANGLFDIGGGTKSRWALEAGGGIGLARVHQHRWQLQANVPAVFANENKIGFAWQAIAGTRYRLTKSLEATLRYRYFNLPNTFLQTSSANALEGSFRTHNVLFGVNYNF